MIGPEERHADSEQCGKSRRKIWYFVRTDDAILSRLIFNSGLLGIDVFATGTNQKLATWEVSKIAFDLRYIFPQYWGQYGSRIFITKFSFSATTYIA
jgi:hypothetical protein